MSILISKTIFQHCIHCPKDAWLKLHKPELRGQFVPSEFELHLMEQGNEVESYAHNLFPGGIEISTTGEHAVEDTRRLMTEHMAALFQATFIVDGFIVRNDVLKWNPGTNLWDLYEVKGTNSMKLDQKERDHITDVAFQVSVMRRAHVPLGRCYLIHLNKEYVRVGDLDINALFTIEDVTEAVDGRIPEIEPKMEAAKEYLNREVEPAGGCECVYSTRRNQCTTFQYSNGHIPKYSVHDISRIHKTKLSNLVEQNIFSLDDVDPDAHKLSEKQTNQVHAHQRQTPVIDAVEIAEFLGSLKFPLYFFDYEAYAPAIPAFSSYSPYKFIPFQFSMHILHEPNGELEHIEFLHEEFSDPSEAVALKLKEIYTGGSVVVWHETFEKTFINVNIAHRLPEHAEFFDRFNNAMVDLEKLFTAQHYIHHGFQGRTSIKKVLPVLAPEFSYASLAIHEGGQASNEWWRMVAPITSAEEKKEIARNLKEYCGLDTKAMYVIYKHLQEIINS
ncbi:MAG: DUF2779 domain-containing protein [Candidatus Moranbacteria bacterium]|nr:DUF2779 domain-containing protein [Candidatus Moranbacteria bacterium]